MTAPSGVNRPKMRRGGRSAGPEGGVGAGGLDSRMVLTPSGLHSGKAAGVSTPDEAVVRSSPPAVREPSCPRGAGKPVAAATGLEAKAALLRLGRHAEDVAPEVPVGDQAEA